MTPQMLKVLDRVTDTVLAGEIGEVFEGLLADNERLTTLVGELQRQVEGHCARIHAQSELLTKAAGRACDECRKRQAEKASYPL